jgi:F-type H+-transporting ATPase subunit f
MYARMPKGPAPKAQPNGFWERYRARYMGENSSFAPVFHVYIALVVIGYTYQVVFGSGKYANW